MNHAVLFSKWFFISLLLVGIGCSASKKAVYTPAGNWNYTVLNTPQGDIKGTMMITKEEESFAGVLKSSNGTINMKDVSIEENVLSSTFYYEGYKFNFKGTFEGEAFNGNISFSDGEFAVNATRTPPES